MPVDTKHAEYVLYEESWRALRDAYEGSSAVKGARATVVPVRGVHLNGTRYLPRPLGMVREEQYAAYRDRATWRGSTEVAVHGLTGASFRREPQLEAPAVLEPQLEDVTQTGVPLRTFAEQALREGLLMGRFGILVDFPKPETLPSGQIVPPPPQSRPYWVAWRAEDIVNWRTRQRQGDTVTSLVVLREVVPVPQGVWPSDDFFVTTDVLQYRVLRLNEAGWYEVSLWREVPEPSFAGRPQPFFLVDTWLPTREGELMDFIPFIFIAPFSLEPAVEKSLMEPLVEINYRYYRHSADYEHGLHMTALPTAYVCSTAENPGDLLIGAATAWWIPDSAAKVGMLEFHGQGLQSHERALDTDIKDMASLGARLLEPAPLTQETLGAVMLRTQGTESPMQSLIRTTSQGLTQALQVHAYWAGLTENPDDTSIHITLNRDLVATTMEPQMLTALVQALLQGTMSYETFYYNLQQGEIARPMIDSDEEQALIDLRQEQRALAMQPLPTRPGQPPPAQPQPPVPAGQNGQRR